MTFESYLNEAMALRKNPMVKAWIATYQEIQEVKYKNCQHCGFPHHDGLICNGATFGAIDFGGRYYFINLGNVVWWVHFMKSHAPPGAFHWRDQKFFARTKDGVQITFFTEYNGHPQKNVWTIPPLEWESIVSAVSNQKPAAAQGDEGKGGEDAAD